MNQIQAVAAQAIPGFDDSQKWIANNGLGAVVAIVVLWMLYRFTRSLILILSRRVDTAVGYFTTKLDSISENQTSALRDVHQQHIDTMREISDKQSESLNRLADAQDRLTTTLREQNGALSSVAESNRIIMMFISKNMEELHAHRAVVEPRLEEIEEGK